MARVMMENVSKIFGQVKAAKDFNLTVEDKEFAILVGPSGCGKSTTLRMVGGWRSRAVARSPSVIEK